MKWVSIFKYLRINYGGTAAHAENFKQEVSFDSSISSEKLRVRLSNKYSKNKLSISSASVCGKKLTVGGDEKIVLLPGQEVFSDEVKCRIRYGDRLNVSMDFAGLISIDSACCFVAQEGAAVEITKDGARSAFIDEEPSNPIGTAFIGFDAVQAYTDDNVKVVAAFGDSITHMSFYTNALQKRLLAEAPGMATLINSGIGGNRLLDDATFIKELGKPLALFGEAGTKRFERDVFELDSVSSVLALIGINDIMHPIQLEEKQETIAANELIKGCKELIDCAHEHGAKIYIGTITPCGNDEYPKGWLPKFESVRIPVNYWIRSSGVPDGFFDFDKALGDKSKPGYMAESCHIGDGLHPNTKGGKIMAECVDIDTII